MPRLALICLILFPLLLAGQVRQGEKLLKERAYEAAMEAFQAAGEADPAALLGQAKVYANSRYAGYDPQKAYGIVQGLLKNRAGLTENEAERAEKDLPISDIRRVAAGIESQQVRQLRKSEDLADFDRFFAGYPEASDRKQKEATKLRNELALAAIVQANDYATARDLTTAYELYTALSETGLKDTVLNRFLREYGWEAYDRFAAENPDSPYVIDAEKRKVDQLLAGDRVAPLMTYMRANNGSPFAYLVYEKSPDLALRAPDDLLGLQDWLTTFKQTDTTHWSAIYSNYLATWAGHDDLRGATYFQMLQLAKGKLSEEESLAAQQAALGILRTKLLAEGADRELLKALMPYVDPLTNDQELQSFWLTKYQGLYGREQGAIRYRADYPATIMGDRIEQELADIEAERRLNAEQLLEKRKELARADSERTGWNYKNHEAWRKAQRKRIATGQSPQPYLLPFTVNSEYGEYKANETTDGRNLYFTRNDGAEDIYRSRKSPEGEWEEAELVEDVSTEKRNESIQLVTVDGSEMLFFNNGRFYTTKKTATGWGEPVIVSQNINEKGWQADAWVSADNRTFFFVREVERRGKDMYVSRRGEDGDWGPARRLPDNLNTRLEDRSPVLASDLRTLYFTSNGHGGEGLSDIFVSERLDDTYLKWSDPRNLGSWINTPEDEWLIRLTPDGERFYYSSTWDESSDVFEIFLPTKVKPKAVIVVEGKVENKDGEGIATTIVWQDLSSGEILQETRSDPEDGSWVATLPGFGRDKVGYRISQEGYFSTSGYVLIDGQQKRILLDRPVKIYTPEQLREESIVLPLENLFFATGEYRLDSTSFPELNELADLILTASLCVEISGHTDNVGNPLDNLELSRKRAEAVLNYLLEKEIPADCLKSKGYGEAEPIANNNSLNGRARNRRVEVRFE
ncbi:hypothetical protein CEQ90_02010 [Lewinellaceae bacterium SD302]|nr:hypothetical protein CEQ90_02010 [Lewinellaceae bacterium SD302]